MVPRLLRLRNFMSYGDEPVEIDFTDIHLACLSGGNGHGKSALLDAITWALWGESRARREDDLVARGASSLEVELEFEAGGGRYRVLRKRTLRPNSPSSAMLELQMMGEGGYRAVTGGAMRETQERLLDILKLSYKTFINSTFLLQGRADEFTVKSPTERKGVLGEILGLEEYDRLAEKARFAARDLAGEARRKGDDIAAAEGELARRPALSLEKAELEASREAALAAARVADEAYWTARVERERLQEKEQGLDELQRSLDALSAELARLGRRRDEADRAVRATATLLADEATIVAGVAELRRVREERDELGGRAARAMALERAVDDVRREIDAEKVRLQSEERSARDEADRLARDTSQEAALRRQVEEYARDEASLAGIEVERAAVARKIDSVNASITATENENSGLEGEMKPLRERLKLLQERDALCPVCQKPLDDDERRRLVAEYKSEGVAKNGRVKANNEKIAGLNREMQELKEQDALQAARLVGLRKRAGELGAVRQRLRGVEEAAAAAREAMARAEAARGALQAEDYAHEARGRLALAREDARAAGYDPARYTALQARARQLEPLEAKEAGLATARERHDNALAAIATIDEDVARRRQELDVAEASVAALREVLAGLPAAAAREGTRKAATEAAGAREKELGRRVTAIENLLRVLDDREERLRASRAALAALEQEGDAHTELAHAFGRAGIQAMIIDNALPELETGANRILARMSDNGMQVRFSTQREGSKRDVIETLDISIADAEGTRPYEMYSGGEAFRVNFAIRIALSRLLAERAGAQLQMLVIDEGFGTQDAQGRERLVEAIASVAQDFEKIIIVTHIDELKDMFTTRIDVVKDTGGSRVTVTAA